MSVRAWQLVSANAWLVCLLAPVVVFVHACVLCVSAVTVHTGVRLRSILTNVLIERQCLECVCCFISLDTEVGTPWNFPSPD